MSPSDHDTCRIDGEKVPKEIFRWTNLSLFFTFQVVTNKAALGLWGGLREKQRYQDEDSNCLKL